MPSREQVAQRYAGRPYAVISADGHCGADLPDYKPYLESEYHERFDAWAATYVDAWGEIATRVDDENRDTDTSFRYGVFSYDLTMNWDSDLRLSFLERQGVVGEVLFPNTVPPFNPSGVLTSPGPRTPEEYELRWAGLRAHNRWLSDFCAAAPGRRAGLAQLYLDDLDDTMAEIRRAHASGLKGVLLPGDNVLKMQGYYRKAYEPIWALCAELGLPVHTHQTFPNEGVQEGSGAIWAGILETDFFSQRPLAHFVCSGVFELHPALKLVITEASGGKWVTSHAKLMDLMYEEARSTDTYPTFTTAVAAEAARELTRRPSEYVASNVFIGNPVDLTGALRANVPNVMFGVDLPHSEGCWAHTLEGLRVTLGGLTEEETRIVTSVTAAECYGFDLERLQLIADDVGPNPAEVASSVDWDTLPTYPGETLCHYFIRPPVPSGGAPGELVRSRP